VFVLQGHSEELWAIAGHPTEPEFVTAGYDQMVMLWHSETHRLLWKTLVEVRTNVILVSLPICSLTIIIHQTQPKLLFFAVRFVWMMS